MAVYAKKLICVRKRTKPQDFHSCYRTPGPQKGFTRVLEEVSEGFLKGFRRGQPKDPSKPLQFKMPSRTLQEGVDIDDTLGLPGP